MKHSLKIKSIFTVYAAYALPMKTYKQCTHAHTSPQMPGKLVGTFSSKYAFYKTSAKCLPHTQVT